MDLLFRNNFTLTEELIFECRVAFASKYDKFISVFGLFISLFGLIYLESNLQDKFIFAFCLFCCIYMLFFLPKIRAKKRYKQYLALHNCKPIQKSIDFYSDSFESISSNGSRVSISYNNIKKIYNRSNMLIFMCKNNLLVFIKKDEFSQGTYYDFKTFITTKTNLSF